MSTSARKRLMRDFKRLQVRGALAAPAHRAACVLRGRFGARC
jgi:hypothetical protein